MKSWLKWLLIGLLIAGVGLGVMRALKTRKTSRRPWPPPAPAKRKLWWNWPAPI
jgi:hypothetical protein